MAIMYGVGEASVVFLGYIFVFEEVGTCFKIKTYFVIFLLCFAASLHAVDSGNNNSDDNKQSRKVRITTEMGSLVCGIIKAFRLLCSVSRIVNNRLVDDFTKTSRPCPPFCIHPITAAPGVAYN